MKKKNIMLIVWIPLFAVMGSVSSSFAECTGNSCYERVQRLYLSNTGDIFIGTEGDETLLGCTPESQVYIVLRNNHVLHKEIFATLLSAHFLGQVVRIRIVQGSSPCEVSYVVTDTTF